MMVRSMTRDMVMSVWFWGIGASEWVCRWWWGDGAAAAACWGVGWLPLLLADDCGMWKGWIIFDLLGSSDSGYDSVGMLDITIA